MDKNRICETLESLGLTKTEVIIYLTLIKKGASSAYRISKEANLYKANTYAAIEGLVRKNLAIKEIKESKQLFRAVSPEELIGNLDRQKEKLQEILPFIQRSINEELEEVSVFTGVESLFNIFYKLLEKKQPIYVFDIPSYVPEIVITHINHFHKERIKKKIFMYHIYDYNAVERISYLNKLRYTKAKKGPKERLSLTSTLICGDVTLLINWKKGIKIVKIVDKDFAEEYRKQFDLLWNYKS